MEISVSDAKAQIADLARRAEAGGDVVLTRFGKAVARPVPAVPRPTAAARRAVLDAVRASGRAVAAPGPTAASAVLEKAGGVAISAGTFAEASIVAGRRGVARGMEALVRGVGMEVVPVTDATARRVSDAHARRGKGVHPAALNLGDCFAYALAEERACPLLFVGEDFARTGVASCL